MRKTKVFISSNAIKDLRKIPKHIRDKLNFWRFFVETKGIIEARKVPGFHDEPLRGNRKGQRSIRLSKAYRAFYIMRDSGEIELEYIEVIEVNKHDYS